jgi:hypothetical protein
VARSHQILRPDGIGGWTSPTAWTRPDGVQTGSVGAWLTAAAGTTTITLQGTVVHTDAPAAAWSNLASWTLEGAELAASSGLQPVFLGTCRFFRWVVSSTSAPPLGAAMHLCIETLSPTE